MQRCSRQTGRGSRELSGSLLLFMTFTVQDEDDEEDDEDLDGDPFAGEEGRVMRDEDNVG